jgi:polar amino acid transport system substrate-binding protein
MKGIAALLLGLCGAVHAAEPPVQICLGESNEWPPFTYWERRDGQPDPTRLTGSATALVLGALDQLGLEYRIHYLPWARVQQELAEYADKRRCELTWDASYKPERAEYAFYSVPLYRTQLGLFYSRRRFAEPPQLQGPGRLRGFRVCGVIGYNYAPYGIGEEIQLVPSIQQSLDMLERGRCDLFPSEVEPLRGGIALGIYQGHPQLRHLKLEQSKQFYVLVSKGSPRAANLINRLNQALIAAEESGRSVEVFRRFLPPVAE